MSSSPTKTAPAGAKSVPSSGTKSTASSPVDSKDGKKTPPADSKGGKKTPPADSKGGKKTPPASSKDTKSPPSEGVKDTKSPPSGGTKTPPSRSAPTSKASKHSRSAKKHIKLCKHFCNLIPTNVPGPSEAQNVLHPRKDVFVLKVSKVSPTGGRKSKLELELVTPKYYTKKLPYRVDTRETQCESEAPVCCCFQRPC